MRGGGDLSCSFGEVETQVDLPVDFHGGCALDGDAHLADVKNFAEVEHFAFVHFAFAHFARGDLICGVPGENGVSGRVYFLAHAAPTVQGYT